MEIAQVEAFLAVGTFGGFRRAAEALHLTQPAVSARIRSLEASLGVALFERAGGLALSAAGRAFRPHAERLLQEVALARQAVHDLRPAAAGAVRMAASLSVCTYLLPEILDEFRAAHPGVLITVRAGHSKELLDMVLRGEADVGLARSLSHPEVERVRLRDDALVLVGTPAVCGRRRRARLEEVVDLPLIVFDRGSGDWTLTHALFRGSGLVPNVILEVDTIEAAKRMVERGLGVAFLPELAVDADVRARRLVAVDLVDARPIVRSLDVVYPRQRPLSTEAAALVAAVRAAALGRGRAERASGPRAAHPTARRKRRP